MSVTVMGDVIALVGACLVEDAEPLLVALQADPGRSVDVGEATRLHLAVVQLLLAARPPLTGVPADSVLRDRLLPLLREVNS
ncbi:MAG: hypothetical protein ABW128_14080 [Rhizorhabdus sp.]